MIYNQDGNPCIFKKATLYEKGIEKRFFFYFNETWYNNRGDKMKILCIGHVAYDITIPLEDFPIENTKNRVPSRVECGGGPASNAAYLLGKWGMDTYIAGVIGTDIYAKKIKKEFEEVAVHTNYLEMNHDHQTTSSFIIANKKNGSRTIFTYRPSTVKMNPIELDFEPDVILIDGQEIEISRSIIKRYPNAISIIDAGRAKPEIIELAKMVNYTVCSKEFAENVTGLTIDYDKTHTLIDLYRKMEEKFKNNIVITLESKGALYKYQNEIKLMPSIKVKAVDSTGAGDLFHGAFAYGIAKNMPYEEIIKIANLTGALSVTKIGGRFSAPSKEEIKQVYHDFE